MPKHGGSTDGSRPERGVVCASDREKSNEIGIEAAREFVNGHFELAIASFRRAADLDPSYPENWSDLAAAYYNLENWPEAIRSANKAIQLNAHHAQALWLLAHSQIKMNDIRPAVANIRRVLKLAETGRGVWDDEPFKPDTTLTVEMNMTISECLERMGHQDQALLHVTTASQLSPRDPDIRRQRARLLAALGRIDECKRDLILANSVDPEDDISLRDTLGTYVNVYTMDESPTALLDLMQLFSAHDYNAVIRSASQYLRKHPAKAGFHYYLGLAELRKGHLSEALKHVGRSVELDRYCPIGNMIYGDVLLMAESKSQAQESWSSALESLAEVPAFEPESDAAERQSRTEELRLRLKLFSEPQAAVVPIIGSNASLTDEGCDVWTRDADRGMEDGLVCVHLGRPDLAVRFLRPLANHRELYSDPPDRGSACYLLGLAYARLDTPDEALDYLAECLKASPHHLDANVLQSELYLALGQADKAESAARRALGINSKSATALSALATVLDRRGKDEGALTALHEATQLEAASYDTWAAKARQAEASGQIDTAIGAWERVNELRPGCAATQCHIGVLLHRQGAYERATRALEGALLLQLSVADRVLCLKLLASMCGSYARHRNALRALKDAAKLKPDDCELLLLTSMTYRALQQPLHAIRLLEDAMRRRIDSDELLRELAELYLEGGKGRRCCNLLENASPRVSLSAATLSILGDARLALKEWDAAVSTFSAALKLDAQFPGAHYGLASAFWAKEDPDGARTHWNILKTLDGSAAFRLAERLPGLYGKS